MSKTNTITEKSAKPGRDETGKEQELKMEDVPTDDRNELKPLSMKSLKDAVYDDFDFIKEVSEAHSIRASRWDVVASWTRLVVAFTAALSAVSLVANNVFFSITFSVLTALIAAMNAAFNPPESSAKHRLSAKEYHLISRRIELLWRKVGEYGWSEDELDEKDLKELYEHYLSHRSDIEEATERAPAINRLKRKRKYKNREMRSWWAYWREKRGLKREAKFRQFHLAMRLKREEAEMSYESKRKQLGHDGT